MSSRDVLSRRQILLLIAVNAAISAIISLAVGLLLLRPGAVTLAPADTPTVAGATAGTTAGTAAVAGAPTPTAPIAGTRPVVHVVQAGDTLSGLAFQYDVPEADIIAANDLQNPNMLQVGIELIIPVGGVPQITPTWTPNPTPTETQIPFEPPSAGLTATALAQAGAIATGASTDAAPLDVAIVQVVSPGIVEREAVIIANNGTQIVDMHGWTLSDESGNVYTFPDLRVYPGIQVTLNTRGGTNGSPSLNFFWDMLQPVWSVAELATLRDAAGNEVAHATVR